MHYSVLGGVVNGVVPVNSNAANMTAVGHATVATIGGVAIDGTAAVDTAVATGTGSRRRVGARGPLSELRQLDWSPIGRGGRHGQAIGV